MASSPVSDSFGSENIWILNLGHSGTPGASNYLLAIFFMNLTIYGIYYCTMKQINGEKINKIPLVNLKQKSLNEEQYFVFRSTRALALSASYLRSISSPRWTLIDKSVHIYTDKNTQSHTLGTWERWSILGLRVLDLLRTLPHTSGNCTMGSSILQSLAWVESWCPHNFLHFQNFLDTWGMWGNRGWCCVLAQLLLVGLTAPCQDYFKHK